MELNKWYICDVKPRVIYIASSLERALFMPVRISKIRLLNSLILLPENGFLFLVLFPVEFELSSDACLFYVQFSTAGLLWSVHCGQALRSLAVVGERGTHVLCDIGSIG